ncbi:hypothetical protein [Mycoplasma sp. 'Moose RK']|uniref:hypothetical protein n=1 Tax=Mycoplasma sp. 'Moose RK' TaxID=2780095 RepID=UPI0018C269E0|nr:hypothetical protein [Mycoplasma sp. 'Moose RK']MBG0730753.1 hypothetical protein [Mycoplasma sp. 'Moose RK']
MANFIRKITRRQQLILVAVFPLVVAGVSVGFSQFQSLNFESNPIRYWQHNPSTIEKNGNKTGQENPITEIRPTEKLIVAPPAEVSPLPEKLPQKEAKVTKKEIEKTAPVDPGAKKQIDIPLTRPEVISKSQKPSLSTSDSRLENLKTKARKVKKFVIRSWYSLFYHKKINNKTFFYFLCGRTLKGNFPTLSF